MAGVKCFETVWREGFQGCEGNCSENSPVLPVQRHVGWRWGVPEWQIVFSILICDEFYSRGA